MAISMFVGRWRYVNSLAPPQVRLDLREHLLRSLAPPEEPYGNLKMFEDFWQRTTCRQGEATRAPPNHPTGL